MRTEPHTDMNPFILSTLTVFVIFIAWVESYNLRLRLRSFKSHVFQTWGRANWVVPTPRETQTWMRRTVKQKY